MTAETFATSPIIRAPKRLRLEEGEWSSRAGFIPGLDGLRALSIGVVMLGHFFLKGGGGLAALGVYIFFVISGFLITRLLMVESKAEGAISVPHFYARRMLRLYPVLIAYLAVVIFMKISSGGVAPAIEISSVFFYFTNYLIAFRELSGHSFELPIGVLWSLAVEEHFYLFCPLIVWALRGSPRKVLLFGLVMCAAPLLIRSVYVLVWPSLAGTNIIYRLSEARFDSIAYGVVLAALCDLRTDIVRRLSSLPALILGCTLIAGSVAVDNAVFSDTLKLTLISIGALTIVAHVVFGQAPIFQAVANWSLAAWIGRLSYSLYVWHGGARFFLATFGINSASLNPILAGILLTTVSLLTAVASYYLVERPIMNLRRHLPRPIKRHAVVAG